MANSTISKPSSKKKSLPPTYRFRSFCAFLLGRMQRARYKRLIIVEGKGLVPRSECAIRNQIAGEAIAYGAVVEHRDGSISHAAVCTASGQMRIGMLLDVLSLDMVTPNYRLRETPALQPPPAAPFAIGETIEHPLLKNAAVTATAWIDGLHPHWCICAKGTDRTIIDAAQAFTRADQVAA